jgi:hypothetical protein
LTDVQSLIGDHAWARAVNSLTDVELIRVVRAMNAVDRAVASAISTSTKAST